MPKTVVRENENIEDALKRFKRDVSRSEIGRAHVLNSKSR